MGWQSIWIVGVSACVIFILHHKIQKVAKCTFWYQLTWVVPEKVQRAVKWLSVWVCVCVFSGINRVSWYQKKHSLTHTYPEHQSSFISFLHLLWSMASSLFNLLAWQSICTTSVQVLFGLRLDLALSTSYSIHFFTQSLSSFHNTCPYHCHLFCCSTGIMSANPSLSLLYVILWILLCKNWSHRCIISCCVLVLNHCFFQWWVFNTVCHISMLRICYEHDIGLSVRLSVCNVGSLKSHNATRSGNRRITG